MTPRMPLHETAISADPLTTQVHCGDALEVLQSFPSSSIDCCLTSPPYWGQREYSNGGIGLESTSEEYINEL